MALPATHIRFALAVADRLRIADPGAYLTGTLYPDSRWVTGIDRKLTHSPQCIDPGFATDDFSLGWHVHCRCDRIQGEIHDDLLEGLSELTPAQRWIRVSAAKVVQDMNDAKQGDIGAHLAVLNHARTPCGESPDKVAAYFGFVQRAYRSSTPPAWRDYVRLWTNVGLDRLRIERIERQVEKIMRDSQLVGAIHVAFDRMVRQWSDRPTLQGRDHSTGIR